MTMYNTLQDFQKSDRIIRKDLSTGIDVFLSHLKGGVNLFHTTGNHNIQILNDALDTASAGKLPRNRIIDWLNPLVGHQVEKVEAGYSRFGAKRDDTEYAAIVEAAPAFLTKYPSWEEFKKEADPDCFDAERLLNREIKALGRKVGELSDNGYEQAAKVVAKLRDELKAAMNLDTTLSKKVESAEVSEDESAEVLEGLPVVA